MLIGADNFLYLLSQYRMCWISGQYGGYKTSLAFYLAQKYLKDGYRLLTNCASVWADDFSAVDLLPDNTLRAVFIMDEVGLELKTTTQLERMCTYSRKMDCVYIFPSYWPPVKPAQVLTVQVGMNLLRVGVPFILYKYRVKMGAFEDHGSFSWINPKSVLGIYSTKDPGGRMEKLSLFMDRKVREYRSAYGHEEDSIGADDSLSGLEYTTQLLADAVGNLSDAADTFSAVPRRGKSARR